MITGKTVTVYNWFDIQDEICRMMGIPKDKFRDYHKIVGGDYKDFWHVALDSVVPENMQNGSIVTMFPHEDIEYSIEEHGEWARPFFEAYGKLMDELDPDFNGVLVNFSW